MCFEVVEDIFWNDFTTLFLPLIFDKALLRNDTYNEEYEFFFLLLQSTRRLIDRELFHTRRI